MVFKTDAKRSCAKDYLGSLNLDARKSKLVFCRRQQIIFTPEII